MGEVLGWGRWWGATGCVVARMSRGELNSTVKILIYVDILLFCCWLECQMEYRALLYDLFAFDLISAIRNHDWE